MQKQTSVLMLGDSMHLLDGLESAQPSGSTVVGQASAPSEAAKLLDSLCPPITVVDLFEAERLTGAEKDELHKLASLLRSGGSARVVVVTGSPAERIRAICLEWGSSRVFHEVFDVQSLCAALRGGAGDEPEPAGMRFEERPKTRVAGG